MLVDHGTWTELEDMSRFRMKDELKARLKAFAHQSVRIVAKLDSTQLTRVVSYQLIKSATSSAANYNASCLAQSTAQLRAKLSIVIDELDESIFWLVFLKDEGLVDNDSIKELVKDANSILTILISSRITLQKRK